MVKYRPDLQTEKLTGWADTPPVSRVPLLVWLHKAVRIFLITIREAQANCLSLRSGALTYIILLSMVPMLAMSTAVVKGLGGGNQLKEVVYKYIDTLDQATPSQGTGSTETEKNSGASPRHLEKTGLTAHLRSAAAQLFDYVDRTNFATLGTFGMLGIFLAVILVLNNIEAAMNTIWHVEDGRSILRKISDYLTLMVLLPISLNVALAAGAILESQSLALQIDRYIPAAWIQLLLFKGIPTLFLTVTLYIIYIFFPNTKPKTIPALIGALLAGVLWFATQNLYISMQIGVANYNAIYGSFATVPLFLIWIYFGLLFVLLGAQVAYAIQNCDRYQLVEKKVTPALQLSAAFDVSSLVNARFAEQQGTTQEDIRQTYPFYQKWLLEQTNNTLVSAGILHHSSESGAILPSRPPQTITHQQIIEAVLGADLPDTEGGKASSEALAAAGKAFPGQQIEQEQQERASSLTEPQEN